ncbi:MAG TPA: M23 family metallopeptidase [Syntrophales bacterium]|nr:M23 family metallopeptidase [Syntrophales bacterium]HRT61452.1 M23 family metallopeptidase [Syntrophales bacterium]
MQNNFYTFLIIPQKKGPPKKITVSRRLVKNLLVLSAFVFIASIYFALDYASIKRDKAEVLSLRELTENQKVEIDKMTEKIGQFEQKMADLQQFDEKIRLLAQEMNKKTRIALKPSTRKNLAEVLGVGGPIPEDEAQGAGVDRMNQHMDRLLEEAGYREESFRDLLEFLKKQKSILAYTPSIWPVRGWVTSEFGFRKSPFTGRREFHKGMDIAAKLGKEVVAPADGIVASVDREHGMGNTVQISHTNGLATAYGHLLKCAVRKGQVIRKGDIIGYVGNSGRSTGSHLHYTVLLNGVPVNPRPYLP